MSEPAQLIFDSGGDKTLLLPKACSISVSCFESQDVRQAIAATTKDLIYDLALNGMNLLALDGVTVALDTRKAACEMQTLPDGAVPLEMSDQPETMELARTVAVKRDNEFRFHIVLRASVGLMTLSPKPEDQALACGCIAHEAAHVEHEGIYTEHFPRCTVVRSTAGTDPGKPSSKH